MNPDATSPFAFVQSIFMIVFVLMLFVGVAGGRPETVLQPLMAITGQIVSTLLGVVLSLAAAILRGILSLLLSSLHALLSFWKSSSSRHIR